MVRRAASQLPLVSPLSLTLALEYKHVTIPVQALSHSTQNSIEDRLSSINQWYSRINKRPKSLLSQFACRQISYSPVYRIFCLPSCRPSFHVTTESDQDEAENGGARDDIGSKASAVPSPDPRVCTGSGDDRIPVKTVSALTSALQ